MGKTFEVSDMPPLTLEMHGKLRAMEKDLRLALSRCCNDRELIDPQAAFEYARTYATRFYDCFYDFYSQIPNPAYRPHWRPASEAFAFQRVVKCIQNDFHIELFFKNNPDRVDRIKRTITDHSKLAKDSEVNSFTPTARQIAEYAKSGIDIVSGPPLLKMAVAAWESSGRRAVTAAPSEAAKHRFSGQIKSETAARKLKAFMEKRGLGQTEFAIKANTSDKTIRKFLRTGSIKRSILTEIATAMGTTKEELLS